MANEQQILHRALLTRYLAVQAAGVPATISSSTYGGTSNLQKMIKVQRERLSRAITLGV